MSDPRVNIQPVTVPVRPLTAGKDISQPPQDINQSGAVDLMNVRFHYGQLMMRNGFKVKYQGADEPAMAIIRAEDTEGSMIAMTMIGAKNVWQTENSSDVFQKMKLVKVGTIQGKCNSSTSVLTALSGADIDKISPGTVVSAPTYLTGGQTITSVDKTAQTAYLSGNANGTNTSLFSITISEKVVLTADWTSDLVIWSKGTGTYQPWNINAKTLYPATGYADIIVWTNRVDGVFVMIPASNGSPMACELLEDVSSVGLAGARAVAIYNNRLIVGGTSDNPSQIVWTAPDEFGNFSLADGAGSEIFGDDTSPIANMLPLGDSLIIYKENSVWAMRKTGQSAIPFMFEKISPQGNGLAAPLSVATIHDFHIFLSWDGIYKLSSSGIEPVSLQVRDEILGRTGGRGIVPAHINRCFGMQVEAFNEYWLFIPSGSFPAATNWLEVPIGKLLYVPAAHFTNAHPLITTTNPNVDLFSQPGYRVYGNSVVTPNPLTTAWTHFTLYSDHDIYSDRECANSGDYALKTMPYSANMYWDVVMDSVGLASTHIGGPFTGQYLRFDNT
jgi:hypothetical protein